MVFLHVGEKILKIWLLVLTQYTNVTDKRTDGYRLNSIASRSKNRAAFIFIITLASVGQFLPRDAYASRGLCRRNYVRLSVTRRYCVQTVIHILKVFTPLGSPIILVFPHQTGWQYSDGVWQGRCYVCVQCAVVYNQLKAQWRATRKASCSSRMAAHNVLPGKINQTQNDIHTKNIQSVPEV